MATERHPMRHIREILRQKLAHGLSNREVARSLRVSTGSVSGVTARARELGLTLDVIATLTDLALEERFYGVKGCNVTTRPLPDPATLHVELRRTGVTLQLIHHEYLEQHPSGYRYTQFCAHYNEWLARMRQVHRAGEKLFVA